MKCLDANPVQLAIATLSTVFLGSYLSLSGGSKTAPKAPPINASNSDEADFIKCVYFPQLECSPARR